MADGRAPMIFAMFAMFARSEDKWNQQNSPLELVRWGGARASHKTAPNALATPHESASGRILPRSRARVTCR
jgi:hypothetical protein